MLARPHAARLAHAWIIGLIAPRRGARPSVHLDCRAAALEGQKLLQALKPGPEAGWFTLAVRKAGSELSPVRRGKGALALTIDLTVPEIAAGDVTR